MPITPPPSNPGASPQPPYQSSSKYDPRTAVPESPMQAGQKKSGCGCWFYGCFFILLVGIGIIGTIVYGVRTLSHKIEEAASSESAASVSLLEKYTTADFARVNKKIEDFFIVLQSGKGNPEISLSADELNTLIAYRPDWQELKGKLYFEIVGSDVATLISFPMTELGMPDKFINIKAHWNVSYLEEKLTLMVNNLSISDFKLPDALLKELQNKNIGEEILSKADTRDAFRMLEKIEVSQGKILIRVKKEILPLKLDELPTQGQQA